LIGTRSIDRQDDQHQLAVLLQKIDRGLVGTPLDAGNIDLRRQRDACVRVLQRSARDRNRVAVSADDKAAVIEIDQPRFKRIDARFPASGRACQAMYRASGRAAPGVRLHGWPPDRV
jgi:hypothetical protein